MRYPSPGPLARATLSRWERDLPQCISQFCSSFSPIHSHLHRPRLRNRSACRQRIVDDSNFAIDGGRCDFDRYRKQGFLEKAERIVAGMTVVELDLSLIHIS